jgi:dTDP-4-amino-4,6-dideoxygalactose transaminase
VRSGRYVGGPEVAGFEASFADYLRVAHVIAVANGTDALELSLKALGIGRGDEVLVPANTFVATAEAIMSVGAIPRFIDVHPDSGLLDLDSAATRLTPETRAIIPVHLYGRMVNMVELAAFADAHSLLVLEDAAQAHGAELDGRRAGTWGNAGCFSFYPGKNLGALGDAGAVVTNDDSVADTVRLLRDHGRREREAHEAIGVNSRMDPIQAAVLAVKLPHMDRWQEARRAAARRYRMGLDGLVDWPVDLGMAHAHHLFPILVENRDEVQARLAAAEIATGVHYRQALPSIPGLASEDSCPEALRRADTQLSLPMHPYLSEQDVDLVVDRVLEAVKG